MQHEITRRIPLLDEEGKLTQIGFARRLLPAYRRQDIRAKSRMIRERECYFIGNPRFAVLLSVSLSGNSSVNSISLADFEAVSVETCTKRRRFFNKSVTMSEQAENGDTSSFGKHHSIYFKNNHGLRTLVAQVEQFGQEGSFYLRAELSEPPEESLVTASPCGEAGFRFAQHQNWMRVQGQICYGSEVWVLNPSDSFATLTWERGTWKPYSTGWICSGSGVTDDGRPFGMHLSSEAQGGVLENMVFLDGKGYPLEEISFTRPRGRNKTMPWCIQNAGLDLKFVPLLDVTERIGKEKVRRVYGHYSGTVTLENGLACSVVNLVGLAEQTDRKQ
ncbi:MAG: DUF2804 domain-containing protein [Oscillospiraceae bacterium]